MSTSFEEADPLSLKIVVVPSLASESSAAERSGPRIAGRKKIKRFFFDYRQRRQGPAIEFVSSTRTTDGKYSKIGQFITGRHVVARGLLLEALDAAIVPGLSNRDVEALEASGAIVIENAVVTIDVPSSAASQSPDAWHLRDINHDAAAAKNLTGKDVLIGVLDTGVDANHPAFLGKTIHYGAFTPSGERAADVTPKDFGTHGTHVCGLCAGRGIGVAPDANLAVAAVLTKRTAQGRYEGTLGQILAGLNWLARGGAGLPRPVDVVNASLGSAARDKKYYQLVETYRAAGLQIVASVGNDGVKGADHHTAPASFDLVLAVGASDRNGQVAPFSAWGASFSHPYSNTLSKPDLLAPGVDLTSCAPGGGYGVSSGTSMSAPLVTGVAALLLQRSPALRGDPERLSAAVLTCLRSSAPQGTGINPQRLGAGNLDLTHI